jgi:hypothetical protein
MSRGFDKLDAAMAAGLDDEAARKIATAASGRDMPATGDADPLLPIPPLSAAIVLHPVNEAVGPTNTVERVGECL